MNIPAVVGTADDGDESDSIPTALAIELVEEGDNNNIQTIPSDNVVASISETTTTTPTTTCSDDGEPRVLEVMGQMIEASGDGDDERPQTQSAGEDDEESNYFGGGGGSGSRAEFVSVALAKKARGAKIGVRMVENARGEIEIDSIETMGLMSESPFRSGDMLVSVNGKRCTGRGVNQVKAMIAQASGTVVLVGRDPRGNARLVESLVEKKNPTDGIGVGFKYGSGGLLKVARVYPYGLAAKSLLNPGDRIVTINNVPCGRFRPREVQRLIRAAPKSVTFLVETRATTGVVVSAASEHTEVPLDANAGTALGGIIRSAHAELGQNNLPSTTAEAADSGQSSGWVKPRSCRELVVTACSSETFLGIVLLSVAFRLG